MKTRHLSLILAIIFLSIAFQKKCCFGAQFWDVSCDSLKNMSDTYLRYRWMHVDAASLMRYIKEGKDLDSLGFLKKFPKECDLHEGFDLRGIGLFGLPDFEGHKIDLSRAHLERSLLSQQNLSKARFQYAHFDEADLTATDLQGADCSLAQFVLVMAGLANFQEAKLFQSNFHGAWLVDANFTDACLMSANFEGSLLVGGDLSGADLRYTKFENTFLENTKLDKANCRNIRWEGYFVGEERNADLIADALKERDVHAAEAKYRQNFEKLFGYSRKILSIEIIPFIKKEIMIQDYERAKYTYRYLKNIYRNYDFHEIAKEFHFRENCVATKLSSKPFSWLARKLLFEWTYGYGSRPWRLFWSSAIVVLLFAMGYVVLSILPIKSGIYQSDKRNKSPVRITTKCLSDLPSVFVNTLHFSLLTFVTFGYGTITPQQWVRMLRLEEIDLKAVRWARIVSALESLVGIYLLALFATVVFGK